MARKAQKKKFKSISFTTPPFRGAFLHLDEPDDNDKYSLVALFPPKLKGFNMPEEIDDIMDKLIEVMEDRFGDDDRDWPDGANDMTPDRKFYDCANLRKRWNGFEPGWWALKMATNEQPGVVDEDKEEVLNIKREAFPGRWMRAKVTIASYDQKTAGVTVYVDHIQLLEDDGVSFSGKGRPENAFDDYKMEGADNGRRRKRRDEDDEGDGGKSRRAGSRRSRDEDGDDDGDDRGGRRRSARSRDDDSEERGSSRASRRRSRDEDDGDEKPARRRRPRDEDEEETKAPARSSSRRRSRDEDEEDEGSGRGRGSRSAGRSRRDEEEDEDRPARSSRGHSRGDDADEDDDERPSRRSRNTRESNEDDRPSRRSGGSRSRRDRDDEDDDDEAWN